METRVSEERIRRLFETIGAHGRREDGGCERLAFSPEERTARSALADAAARLGFHIFRDAIGSVFALRPGTDPEAEAIYTGSHLDTVPGGGCFDGASGVLCGLAALELLETEQISTRRPLVLVSWANEEGARFAPAMMGSGVFTGAIPFETAAASTDADGVTVREELAREAGIPGGTGNAAAAGANRGVTGNAEAAAEPGVSDNAEAKPGNAAAAEAAADDSGVTGNPGATAGATATPGAAPAPTRLPRPAAYLELHPEQGRILEAEGVRIGIVEGVQGQAAGDWTMAGRADHAGSTPMDDRADALVAAARLIAAVPQIAAGEAPGVATVGGLRVTPGARNAVPGRVESTLDIRHPDDAAVGRMLEAVLESGRRFATEEGCSFEWREAWRAGAVRFSHTVMGAVEEAAAAQGIESKRLTSGAGHDAVHMAPLCPTGMIFVPSRDGISHSPDELTSYEDLAAGATVLAEALVRLAR